MEFVVSNLDVPSSLSSFNRTRRQLRTQRFKDFDLDEEEIRGAIKQTLKMIEYCEWLAKESDDESLRHHEFSRWFRSGE